jgi:hypothetical protein
MLIMKNALTILSALLLAMDATAFTFVGGHQRGYKPGDSAKRISEVGASEVKGWAFSVILTDLAMHDYVPKVRESEVEVPEGVDAL